LAPLLDADIVVDAAPKSLVDIPSRPASTRSRNFSSLYLNGTYR